MYLTHDEGKLLITEKFTKTLKAKIYKTHKVNDSKSHLSYLNK